MRKAFADTLFRLAEENSRVMFLTGDLGFQVFDDFQTRFGPRYINTGIAEAQMVCAAAGLAKEGWRPLIYSIASFATGRAFEQIRVNISYPNLPVVVVGAGGGYTYASAGVTHHAAEDLALMALLPAMTVVAPGDAHEITSLLPQLLKLDGPSYIRVGRYGEDTYEAEAPVVLGQARLLQTGERIAVISTGDLASVTLHAMANLKAEGIHPIVYQMHTVKPLDTAVLDQLVHQVDTLVLVEEHSPIGGLAAAVQAWRATRPEALRLIRLGPPDALALGNLKRETLRQRWCYDAEAIAQTCRSAWSESKIK